MRVWGDYNIIEWVQYVEWTGQRMRGELIIIIIYLTVIVFVNMTICRGKSEAFFIYCKALYSACDDSSNVNW